MKTGCDSSQADVAITEETLEFDKNALWTSFLVDKRI